MMVQVINAGEGVEKREPSSTVGGWPRAGRNGRKRVTANVYKVSLGGDTKGLW